MEAKTITLEELDAYICIASFYITRECRLNGRETSTLIDLVTDIRDRIVGHVTGKIPFDQEDLNLVYETKARLDFLRAVLETEGG